MRISQPGTVVSNKATCGRVKSRGRQRPKEMGLKMVLAGERLQCGRESGGVRSPHEGEAGTRCRLPGSCRSESAGKRRQGAMGKREAEPAATPNLSKAERIKTARKKKKKKNKKTKNKNDSNAALHVNPKLCSRPGNVKTS